MNWEYEMQSVAEPVNTTVGGTRVAGGTQIHVDITFSVFKWSEKEKGPVSLVPQPSEVTARTANPELPLGFAVPSPRCVIVPQENPTRASVRFTLALSNLALAAIEEARDGGSLEFAMQLAAHPIGVSWRQGCAPGVQVGPTTGTYTFSVSKERWLAVLKSVGYCDTLVTELPLPISGPDATASGRRRLAQAVTARNDGSYAEAMRRCRIALDELKLAGFGGKSSSQVAQFLQENAGSMSQVERYSVLQLALKLFLSPTHHANAPDEFYTRADAELAIAVTAALLRLAPSWGSEATLNEAP